MSRRLFVGDVHGQYDSLMRLWDLISLDSGDTIYFVGDLIDRGPQSAQVVDFVRANAAGCVRGNHEDLLLDAFAGGNINPLSMQEWLRSGGEMTLASYKDEIEALKRDIEWMQTLPLYIDLGNIWLVHAGVNPTSLLSAQSSNEFCWIRDVFHNSRSPFFEDKHIIVGHTMTFTFPNVLPGQIIEGMGWINIDTGAYDSRGGWLTALDWDNQMVYQVNTFNSKQRVRSYMDSTVKLEPSSLKPIRSRRPL